MNPLLAPPCKTSKRDRRDHRLPSGGGNRHGAKVEVTEDWAAREGCSGDLDVSAGDVLVLTHPENEGFFQGTRLRDDRTGWFPIGVVQMCSRAVESQPSPRPAEPSPRRPAPAEPEEPAEPEPDAHPGGEWEMFIDPGTQRMWFWNRDSQEHFFADSPGQWKQFADSDCRHWWWHEATGDWFYEAKRAAAA